MKNFRNAQRSLLFMALACAAGVRADDKAASDPFAELDETLDTPVESVEDMPLGAELPSKVESQELPEKLETKSEALPAETPSPHDKLAHDLERASGAPEVNAAGIVQKPYEKDGFWINAYYFVRAKGETWASLSEKLYGRSDRISLLKRWNHGVRLRIGQVVYYNSAMRPDDSSAMKVFSEDFGVPMESLTIGKGDSLSKIGKRLYGHVFTWREIAALNPQIKDPNHVTPGDVIRVQPQVDTRVALENIVSEVTKAKTDALELAAVPTPPKGSNLAVAKPAPTPVVEEFDAPPVAVAAPKVAAPPAPTKAPAPVAPPKVVSFQGSNFLGMIGVLLLLASVGMIGSRKWAKIKAAKAVDNVTKSAGNRNSPV